MRVLGQLALLGVFALAAVTAVPRAAIADQSASPAPAATASAALTARFSTFMTDVLAGNLPATGVTDTMKTAFTPSVMSQVSTTFAPLGTFQRLQFTKQDSAPGFQRFHYIAIFDKGSQPVIFVIDSNQNIAGFFADQGQ
jgi:hypothetical protein